MPAPFVGALLRGSARFLRGSAFGTLWGLRPFVARQPPPPSAQTDVITLTVVLHFMWNLILFVKGNIDFWRSLKMFSIILLR
jgi:hypothetical protein